MIDSLIAGDYSVRVSEDSAVPINILERLNCLASKLQNDDRMHQQRVHLLAKTLSSLNAAIFVFDKENNLQLINPAGEALLGMVAETVLGSSARLIGLESTLAMTDGSIEMLPVGGGHGRWQISKQQLRRSGDPAQLLVLQPVENMLRATEKENFSRLLRVISHEINNSMAPISSMADTMAKMLPNPEEHLDVETHSDITCGLRIIETRSESLQRFLGRYVQFANLPLPVLQPVRLAELCVSSAAFVDCPITIDVDPDAIVLVDPDQMSQALINLIRNAAEAGGGSLVEIESDCCGSMVQLRVLDRGPGPPPSPNLFVPFFTTKEGGSGIGLALSRQIVESVGGSISLNLRTSLVGAVAELRLPMAPSVVPDVQKSGWAHD